jgi:nitroreductase
MRLFEAARWAPSSFNAQQWRALYAHRGTEHWPTFLGLLVEGNKAWAQNAAVLVPFISRTTFEYNGEPGFADRGHGFRRRYSYGVTSRHGIRRCPKNCGQRRALTIAAN